MKLQKH